jgi:hypothetical protein
MMNLREDERTRKEKPLYHSYWKRINKNATAQAMHGCVEDIWFLLSFVTHLNVPQMWKYLHKNGSMMINITRETIKPLLMVKV